MTDLELMEKAKEGRSFSHAPYSNYHVGAALLCKNGKVFTGCNIESATFTPTICAERTAIFKAVSEGETEFEAIAIIGGKDDKIDEFCAPCGVCRQVIAEFMGENAVIVLGNTEKYARYALNDIFPYSFTKENLK